MGEALLSRLLAQQRYLPSEVLVSDSSGDRRQDLAERYGVGVTADNQAVVSAAEALLLAVKPQGFEAVVEGLQVTVTDPTLVISILAGVPLRKLEAAFPGWPVVRAMPNTPATVGAGITALAAGHRAQPNHLDLARQIFATVGEVVEVAEPLMDAVTGLSGSGPGYIAMVVEALTDGGVAAGLPRGIATQLALQTVLGTAVLLKETQMHPAALKDRVTSPGGTTIAGIAALEQAGFRSALIAAVQAACQRSRQLGSES